jgi:hypothetical protein
MITHAEPLRITVVGFVAALGLTISTRASGSVPSTGAIHDAGASGAGAGSNDVMAALVREYQLRYTTAREAGASAARIPYFARKYGLPCGTCHDAWVRNNDFGEAFRLRGYRLPADEAPTGPSDIPASVPLSFRLRSELAFESGGRTPLWEWELLTGGTLGEQVSFFGHVNVESQSDSTAETEVEVKSVGFVQLSNLIRDYALGVNIGFSLEEPDLPAFRSHQWITRSKYLKDGMRIPYPATGFDQRNRLRVLRRGPGITFLGARSRWKYALGYKMGTQEGENAHSDTYFLQVQRKIGGLSYRFERGSRTSGALGMFAAAGQVPVHPTGMARSSDRFWRIGFDAEVGQERRWSLAAGTLLGSNDNPYGDLNRESVRSTEWLVRGEYWLARPVVFSVRYEDEILRVPAALNLGTTGRGRVVSNLLLYYVDNVRLSVEAVTYTRRWADATGRVLDRDKLILYFDFAI